jgi:cardiolipin synthase A/B
MGSSHASNETPMNRIPGGSRRPTESVVRDVPIRFLIAISTSSTQTPYHHTADPDKQDAAAVAANLSSLAVDWITQRNPRRPSSQFCQVIMPEFPGSGVWATVLFFVVACLSGAALLTLAFLVRLRQRAITYRLQVPPSSDSEQFVRMLRGVVSLHFCGGNRIRLLKNGDETFPAILGAVERARHTVTYENYIYWAGEIGDRFARLLSEKSRCGVRVHLVLDWIGAVSMERRVLDQMRSAGVEVHFYHPPRLGAIHLFNHRTHRRVLVVDGRVAFTGGVGLGDNWTGDGESDGHWRDNHYLIEGPLAGAIQSVFLDNWLKSSGQVLAEKHYFPELSEAGGCRGAVLSGAPGERISSGRLMLLLFLSAARHRICIEQAYFVPDRPLIEALANAARRGVSVEIILPDEQIDYQGVRRASRALWGPLLEAGVRIFEYQPAMLHAKMLLIDDLWLIAGSANLDFRSLYRNDEVYLVVRDRDVVQQHSECFAADRDQSREVTPDNWRERPLVDKLLDRAAALVRTQL